VVSVLKEVNPTVEEAQRKTREIRGEAPGESHARRNASRISPAFLRALRVSVVSVLKEVSKVIDISSAGFDNPHWFAEPAEMPGCGGIWI
jgi:hypothetical protein